VHRTSDADLLTSPEGFRQFYERHVDAVTAYVARRTRRPELVYDVVGETFARALEHRRHHDPRRGPAVSWLFGIARTVLSDAERHGQVSDAARGRLKIPPVAFDEAARAAVAERSRVSLHEALAALPESQRIATLRRVEGELDYDPLSPRVSASPRPDIVPSRKAPEDPFAALGVRLFLAAGGQLPRSRRRPLALAGAAAVLVIGAVTAFALTRDDHEEVARATPTPTAPPLLTPTPSAAPTDTPRPSRPRQTAPAPRAKPAPTPEPQYDIDFQPDLTAGVAGWCVSVTIRTQVLITGGRSCSPAGPPGTNLIAQGGVYGTPGMMYAVVDRLVQQVRLSDRRRIEPRRDPALPANWRIATWDIDTPSGATPPTFALLDARGRDVTATAATAPPDRLATRRVTPRKPGARPCAITARGSAVRPVSARVVKTPRPLDLVRPSYLSCSRTTLRYHGETFQAAVLLNARDLQALAAPLPSTAGLAARRSGNGWLVVAGGGKAQREAVLKQLRARRP